MVVPLVLVAVARLVAWDAHPLLVAVNALTPFLFLPAVVAIRTGRGTGSDHRPIVADIVRTIGPG
jgi:hypothetical protein